MKTDSRILRQSIVFLSSLIFGFALVSGISGCEKNESLLPSGNTTSNNKKAISEQANGMSQELQAREIDLSSDGNVILDDTPITTFDVIVFDHQAYRSHLPDYKVSINNNGIITYEGRRNVVVKGKFTWELTDVNLSVLHEIFENYGFYSIVPEFDINPDVPLVFTTYRPSQLIVARTIYDDYFGSPEKLIKLRTSVENLIGITPLVTHNVSLGSTIDNVIPAD